MKTAISFISHCNLKSRLLQNTDFTVLMVSIKKNDYLKVYFFCDLASEPTKAVDPLQKLEEIRRAAEALAKRGDDGFEWHSQHYMELTNQYGEVVRIDEASRKALTTGIFSCLFFAFYLLNLLFAIENIQT